MSTFIDKDTLLLMHCDDISTDSSYYNNTISKSGTVNVVTNGKFDKCLDFTSNGNNKLAVAPNDLYKSIGTGDFTIDMWLKFPDTTKRWQTFFASNVSYTDLQLTLYYDKIRFYCGGSGATAAATTIPTPINEWFHAAFVRYNGQMYIYINGKLSCPIMPSTSNLQMTSPQIGYQPSYSDEAFKGYIDEIRFSKGAKWTSDFDVPTSPYRKPVCSNVLNSTEMVVSFIHEYPVEKASIYINDVFDREYTNLSEDQIIVHRYNLDLINSEKNTIKIETVEDGGVAYTEFEYKYLPKLTSYAKTPTVIRRMIDFCERQEKENNILRDILKEKGITEDLTTMRHEELVEYVRLLGNVK